MTLTLGQKDLKYVPVEKKFTALDHRMKTISINDTIKILDGPAKVISQICYQEVDVYIAKRYFFFQYFFLIVVGTSGNCKADL